MPIAIFICHGSRRTRDAKQILIPYLRNFAFHPTILILILREKCKFLALSESFLLINAAVLVQIIILHSLEIAIHR